MTLAEALRDARALLIAGGIDAGDAAVEARALLLHVTGLSPEAPFLRPDTPLAAKDAERLSELLARRVGRREPLAYLIGSREFYGLPFRVTPAVLIPRPETELVVEAVLEYLKGKRDAGHGKVVDVGTGSGAIAVAVAVHAPTAEVWATDLSPDALAVARENAERNGVESRVRFAEGDLVTPAADAAPFDTIASNPPYIAPAEIETLQPEVRDWEPRLALGTHPDPLHFYRRLAAEAPPLLMPDGMLVVEVGQGQAGAVAALWKSAGLTEISVRPDYAGIDRVVSGIRR